MVTNSLMSVWQVHAKWLVQAELASSSTLRTQDISAGSELVQQVRTRRLWIPLPFNQNTHTCSAPYADGVMSSTLKIACSLHWVPLPSCWCKLSSPFNKAHLCAKRNVVSLSIGCMCCIPGNIPTFYLPCLLCRSCKQSTLMQRKSSQRLESRLYASPPWYWKSLR